MVLVPRTFWDTFNAGTPVVDLLIVCCEAQDSVAHRSSYHLLSLWVGHVLLLRDHQQRKKTCSDSLIIEFDFDGCKSCITVLHVVRDSMARHLGRDYKQTKKEEGCPRRYHAVTRRA